MRSLSSLAAAAVCGCAVVVGVGASANASTIYDLNICSDATICTTGTSQGQVKLTQISPTEVDVSVTLTTGVLIVNTGGPHTPFVFNLDAAAAGATVTVLATSSTTPAGWGTPTGSSQATPYGTFTNGIPYLGSQGGVGHGNAGPLDLSVVLASGILISDFVKNSVNGYFFAADVLGTSGGTGSVASNIVACTDCTTVTTNQDTTPLPAALPLFATGLGGLGLLGWRRKRKTARAA